MYETSYTPWKEGKRRLPAMRNDTTVYVTKIQRTDGAQGVQVDIFRGLRAKHLALVDEVRWDKFPSEELLAKMALVL